MNEGVADVLEVMGLAGGYGRVPILHGIDFSVAENEVVGILGHNGMGKSTLLKTIMGFLPAGSGTVRFRAEDVTRMSPHERAGLGVGYVPQGRGIFPQLTVRDNLRFAWHEYAGASEIDVLEGIFSDFSRLRALSDRQGAALSGGEQQLLALARCLMGDPDFLLLDEPTEGIQPSIIDEIGETLLRLREGRGLSILLVEQNLDFISELSDRVLVIERGPDHWRAAKVRPVGPGQGRSVPGVRNRPFNPRAKDSAPSVAQAAKAIRIPCRTAEPTCCPKPGDQHDRKTPDTFADARHGQPVRHEPNG